MTAFKYRLSARTPPFTVEDYRRRARRALPDMVWAYIDYGAEDLRTLEANRAAFDRYRLRRKVLTGNASISTEVRLGDDTLALPVLLAPTGSTGLAHWTGEVGAAQAAERSGTLSIVSTSASYSFEEVAEATSRNHWFQLYPWIDRNAGRHELTLNLMNRARQAGYHTMVVTVDVPAVGNRESERRRGMGNPPVLTPSRVLDGAVHPRWWGSFLRHRRLGGRNLVESVGAKAAMKAINIQYTSIRPDLNWDDLAHMRDAWPGRLYVKGILDEDDASHAVELGADGVVVSNHGGRQLDGDVASLDALPAIAQRIGDRADVLLDGGIRRGSDVVKAISLGADAVCIGRPFLYGLAAGGPAGAEGVLSVLRDELVRVMTLMGVSSVGELDPSRVLPADQAVPPTGGTVRKV